MPHVELLAHLAPRMLHVWHLRRRIPSRCGGRSVWLDMFPEWRMADCRMGGIIGGMNRYLGALVSAVALSGALCLVGAGTAQAATGHFTCGVVSYNAATGAVDGPLCSGGPANATT